MSKTIAIVLALFVLNTVRGEEESPVAISHSVDIDERTAIQEDLKTDDDSRTINIKVINSEPLEQAITRSEIENNANLERPTETESPLTDNDERNGLSEDFEDEVLESKEGDDIEIPEPYVTLDENVGRSDFKFSTETVPNSSHEINVTSLREEFVTKKEGANESNDALESVKSHGKSMILETMLETKGRSGGGPETWEEIKSVSDEDARSFNRLKPLDNSILRTRFSDLIIPNYFKAFSRSTIPPSLYNYQNARPPYFGRLTNPNPPQRRPFENPVQENMRRPDTFSSEYDRPLKQLEDYTDPDSNAYPYKRVTSKERIQSMRPSQNVGLERRLQSQMNPFNNELSPMQYAVNYPYKANARFH